MGILGICMLSTIELDLFSASMGYLVASQLVKGAKATLCFLLDEVRVLSDVVNGDCCGVSTSGIGCLRDSEDINRST